MPPSLTLGYRGTRTLLLLVGLVVVAAVAGTMLLRGVDPVEVTATLFFAPVYLAALLLGVPGGLAAGAAAAVGYLWLRLPAIELVGLSALAGLVLSRVAGFLLFGGVAGWASGTLQGAVDKLEEQDDVDDETGLGNARSVVTAAETERSRVDRYGGVFSLVLASFTDEAGPGRSRREERARLQAFGSRLQGSMRASDHLAHVREGGRRVVAAVLPETGREGAWTVAGGLRERIGRETGADADLQVVSHPGEEDALAAVLERFRAIDARQRP